MLLIAIGHAAYQAKDRPVKMAKIIDGKPAALKLIQV